MPLSPTGAVMLAATRKLWPCRRSRSVAEKMVKWAAENFMYSFASSIVVSCSKPVYSRCCLLWATL